MSFSRKRTEVTDDDGISSPDDTDNTSTEITQEARLLEETGEPEIPVGNASDADVSNSDSSIKTAVDAEISRESSEKLSKLQKSPKKKPYRRTKYDSKIHGESSTRGDDSSDDIESTYLEKSPKKVKYAVKEELVDSVAGTSFGTSGYPNTNLSVLLDSEELEDSSNQQCKSDTRDNTSIINTSETSEVVSTIPEENNDGNAGAAGFTLVKTSDLIAAAVSNSISNQERRPQAGTSNEDTETTTHVIDSNTCVAEKERTRSRHSGANRLLPHEATKSELTPVTPDLFNQEQGNVNEYSIERTTEPCISQTVELLRTETSEDSNISTETMEFICDSGTDRGAETNTDIEKMDYSSESCGGFESTKAGSECSTGVEKMELISESSISHDEVEMECVSVKSTDNEMEYISESVSAHSESVSAHSEFVSAHSDSVSSNSESISYQENVSRHNERTIIEPNIDESVSTERQYIPPILVENVISIESDSNSNEVTNINESNNDETIHINRKFSIPRIESSDTEEYEYNQNKGATNVADSTIAPTEFTSGDQRPIAEGVSRVIVEEPSNSLKKTSFKRKKPSDDSDNGIKGENVSNVSESTDTQGGAEASSIEFPDTDSDDSTGSPKKFRKK